MCIVILEDINDTTKRAISITVAIFTLKGMCYLHLDFQLGVSFKIMTNWHCNIGGNLRRTPYGQFQLSNICILEENLRDLVLLWHMDHEVQVSAFNALHATHKSSLASLGSVPNIAGVLEGFSFFLSRSWTSIFMGGPLRNSNSFPGFSRPVKITFTSLK